MPHLRMRAIKAEDVQKLSSELLPLLASTINTAEDNFTFEKIETRFFFKGKEVTSFPMIEVLWFPRPQEIQDKVAKIINEKVKDLINDDIIVIFTNLTKAGYYENGAHF